MSTISAELAHELAPASELGNESPGESPGESIGEPASDTVTMPVWDLPLRVFHWSLTLAVSAAFATAWLGGRWMQWHVRIGALILGLLLFRLVWGVIGSVHARFASFVPTPANVIAYARGKWRGPGHTPLGALSVLLVLAILMAQLATGLFANDDIAFHGPLFSAVEKSTSDSLTGWHVEVSNLLLSWMAIHTAAILFYAVARRTNLVGPMLTGKKELPRHWMSQVVFVSSRRFIVAAVMASVLVWAVFGGWLTPHAVSPPPAAAQDW